MRKLIIYLLLWILLMGTLWAKSTPTIKYLRIPLEVRTDFGLANPEFVRGTIISETYRDVSQSSEAQFSKVCPKVNGGSDFQVVGTSEVLAVPFAIHAANGLESEMGPEVSRGPKEALHGGTDKRKKDNTRQGSKTTFVTERAGAHVIPAGIPDYVLHFATVQTANLTMPSTPSEGDRITIGFRGSGGSRQVYIQNTLLDSVSINSINYTDGSLSISAPGSGCIQLVYNGSTWILLNGTLTWAAS